LASPLVDGDSLEKTVKDRRPLDCVKPIWQKRFKELWKRRFAGKIPTKWLDLGMSWKDSRMFRGSLGLLPCASHSPGMYCS
jgi:hypothetical protein